MDETSMLHSNISIKRFNSSTLKDYYCVQERDINNGSCVSLHDIIYWS